ncbi:GH25 family lysozyme [Lactobacillus corticis]|uniref:1,4-beta-N-acetylmuramidase n=1 Tax=Lactobacillus corticis TaxID=2201249 RepID=A0A916VH52_9LACO|nr:GH25 family lysozyme [Lactobacillus corticis]GFZ26252.1 1,4-beta-N-acetylmuramidase [Lactobacillus corticis]
MAKVRFHHRYTLPALIICLILVICGLLYAFHNYFSETSQPSGVTTATIGVRLDQDYGSVELSQLENNGISFVYLVSTQGRSYFDDDYLTYRSRMMSTKMAYGTIVRYSNESTASQHYRYLMKKAGRNLGSLPVLIEPAVNDHSSQYLRSMAKFVKKLQQLGKRVMVEESFQTAKYFPKKTLFMAGAKDAPNKMQYAFWRYTTNGHVKNVTNLNKGVTMYTYVGTTQQYKERYGQLTQ